MRGWPRSDTKLPYADWNPLKRDRRLDRINDLITVNLLSSYVTWKLGGSDEVDLALQAPANLMLSRI